MWNRIAIGFRTTITTRTAIDQQWVRNPAKLDHLRPLIERRQG